MGEGGFSPGPVGQIVQKLPKKPTLPMAVTANTNILAQGVTPAYPPSNIEIYVVFDQAGILSVVRTRPNGTTSTEQLNAAAGLTLVASAGYTFDVPVDQGESINLQYGVNANLLSLSIRELAFET